MKIKICGIRRPEDTDYLNQYLPDYAGFILSEAFWRYVSPEQMNILSKNLNRQIQRVGVFVNPASEEILRYAEYLDVIQLHGEETADLIRTIRQETDLEIWKAVRVRHAEDIYYADELPVDKLVLDSFSGISHGGTGTLAPWQLIAENRPQKSFFLAGGISAENVQEAIASVHPYGVDASSSVETDKCKDIAKINNFISQIRK